MASIFKRKRSDSDVVALYAKCDLGERTPDGKIVWRLRRVPDEHQASRPAARRWADDHEAAEQAKRKQGATAAEAPKLCGPLMLSWLETLTNRNADDDRQRMHKHVIPVFKAKQVRAVRVADVMEWVDAMRTATAPTETPPTTGKHRGRKAKVGRLADGTIRHNLNLLSRFFSWATVRGYVEANPCRSIPTTARPQSAPKKNVPYIRDDEMVRKILHALPAPVDLMFYLGHTSGLRLGEVCGLRLSDLDNLADGTIRVRYSYDGPLKEDKRRVGLVKRVPAGLGADAMLRPWINRRLAQGAQPEDLLFVAPEGGCYGRMFVNRAWRSVAASLRLRVGWYEATRHSFASRLLEAGNTFDEVAAALGHSSPVVTGRYYAHFKRETFSGTMRLAVAIVPNATAAEVTPIGEARKRAIATGTTGTMDSTTPARRTARAK